MLVIDVPLGMIWGPCISANPGLEGLQGHFQLSHLQIKILHCSYVLLCFFKLYCHLVAKECLETTSETS